MRRLLKWLGMGLVGVAVLVVLAVGAVYLLTSLRFGRRFEVSPREVLVTADSATLTYGSRLATIYGCARCHGPDLGGRQLLDRPLMGRFVAPNLTEVRTRYSDLDFVRLLRHGVRPDGKGVLPVMPAQSLTHLADDDVAAIIAHVRAVPPVDNRLRSTRPGPLVRFAFVAGLLDLPAETIDHERAPPAAAERTDLMALGRYLAAASCTECHGPDLSGTQGFLTTPNLAVVAAYSLEEFRELLRAGTARGGRELETMSDVARGRFSHYTDREIEALHTYLETLAASVMDES